MIQSLNGRWTALIDNANYTVSVPGALQSCEELGERFPCHAMPNGFLGKAVMTKQFHVEKLKHYTAVVFKGVMPYATVYVNNCKIGTITCCQTMFSFDCSKTIQLGDNKLQVVIEEKNLNLIGGMRFDVLKWSGIFDDVTLVSVDLKIGEPRIGLSGEDMLVRIPAPEAISSALKICDGVDVVKSIRGSIDNGIVCFQLSTLGLTRWSVEVPKLYNFQITLWSAKDRETISFTTGIRQLHCKKKKIYINDRPLYLFGGGDEYFSPTISPLVDRNIIRKRFSAMKELGFNFFRYHTHTPTQTELDICDELGLMVSVEIPILSNFSRITDEEKGLKILTNYIRQTRTHPCILCYCLGNEAIQIMVRNPKEHALACKGDACIRANTDYQLGMFCFGNQGERLELPGDLLTPHLWSQDFRWAYQGLTSVPWEYLPATTDDRPCIVHEFGKYGVWPDDAENIAMPTNGYRLRFRDTNDQLFAKQEAAMLRQRIIRNSKNLSLLCASTILQAVRRQSGISGFVYWTFFRMGIRCGGLCDDLGQVPNQAKKYLLPATAPIGIYADRDFEGRTFYSGEYTNFAITISNFGRTSISSARLCCSLQNSERTLWSESANDVCCNVGEIGEKLKISVQMPIITQAQDLKLTMELWENGKRIAVNCMDIWCYPWAKADRGIRIVTHLHDTALEKNLHRTLWKVTPIWNWLSILSGCEIPEYGFTPTDEKLKTYLPAALEKDPPDIVIADHVDATTDYFLKQGVPVLFIDSGGFSEELYAPRKPDGAFFTCNTFYAPFRSSWEEGNEATVLEGDLFDGDGFGDLRYYSCMEGAMPLLRKETACKLCVSQEGDCLRLFRRVKRQSQQKEESIYFAQTNAKELQDCIYYLDGYIGATPFAITTLDLFADACGQDLLRRIIRKLTKTN